ncbi:tRNA (guanosine(37)-N1)-methyltransferase TrmD [Anaerobacillus alkalilacustris]|uniref:tRNA (guanine-N(1)-)-methyltransferase n=1 Tax=Anaerobacillus alkalilacustris TaxID=393763 RepID=A0A1S2LNE0_9BACI|nr:tRNA (guanosine(37)-N1)-methyltransferase TrmD [Anaerobacillus alkalilacustris]OIJ13187.1 tRNA (guanosine(37)-N1)-methyltransferase TrmD [Anaerobacillus alkalilacustris]
MRYDILTLFPEMFTGVLGHSILKRAEEKKIVNYNVVDFRTFSKDKHQRVDDYPYGGGGGMVLTPQPVFDAIEEITKQSRCEKRRVILLCPQGERYSQKKAEELAQCDQLIFICGHYEGYDERIREHLVTDEISIGDYVLTGGELGAMVIIDSVTRLLTGVLGNETSAITDSFSSGLLEYPHYTRPVDFRGLKVPDVLLSGHHENIEQWRHKQALKRTFERRPDLLNERKLSEKERDWIQSIKKDK